MMLLAFSEAVRLAVGGFAVRRRGWARGKYMVYVPGSKVYVDPERPLGKALPHLVGNALFYQAHLDIVMVAANGTVTVANWQANVVDAMADDWIRMDPDEVPMRAAV